MGWTAHILPNRQWQLWTRHGTCGVYIQKKGDQEEIEIPSELLKMLVADDIRSYKISSLEQMDSNLILGLPEDHSV